MTLRTAAALLALLAALPATATEYGPMRADKSRIDFVARQMGVPSAGRFGKFTANVVFDPAHPAQGRARIDVDLASIDAGNAEASEEVKGKAWFNVREFPTASFVSTALRALGNDRYEATGHMTIKGRTRDVVASFTARPDGPSMLLDGSIAVPRLQYAVGEGAWADTSVVADDIQVRFRLTLDAVPAARK